MSDFDPHDFNNLLKTSVNTGIIAPTQGIIPQLEANRALTGVGGQEVKAQSLTPDTSDNIILGDASQTKMTNGTITDTNTSLPDSAVDLITGQAMSEVYGDLSKFAAESDFVAKMNLAFGENWDAVGAKALAEGWFNRDFSAIPPVKVVSSAEIGGANGAFAAATDTIYLSKEFLAQNGANPVAIGDVLLEEVGHSVDARLNVTDTPGDEGAIFAALVQGKELSQSELEGLRGEDDRGTVLFNGQKISIEKADDYYDQNWGGEIFDWSSGKIESKGWYPFTRNDGDAISSRNAISRIWRDGNPGISNGVLGSDKFGVNFYTKADFEAGKTYNFSVTADDYYTIGAIPVNGNQWANISGQDWKWLNDAYGGKKYTFTPETTGKYWVYAGYAEQEGDASFSLSWEKVNGSSYISGLSSLTDGQWDQQSGDGYYFDNIPGNASQDASSELKQVSRDLSTALLGAPFYMSTGYAYDTASIYNGDTISHAGIDYSYDATIGEDYTKILNKRVNAIVKGKVVNVQDYNGIGKFVTVEGEDKKLWLYGHIENSKQVEDEVNPGEEIGKVYDQGGNTHFHLEVHTPPFDNSIIDGVHITNPQQSNLPFVLNNTISPLEAYWQYRNGIKN
jgi:Peptidase family M23